MKLAGALAVVPAAAALVALPLPALLLWVLLGALVGVLAELWCRAAEDMAPARARTTALRIAGGTVLGGCALSGTTLLIGAATVAVVAAALVAVTARLIFIRTCR